MVYSVLLPTTPIENDASLFIIDFESMQLGLPAGDVGTMIAEMYALYLYKSIEAGLWIITGFVQAYGYVSDDFAFRAALQVGAHLVCTTTVFPGWGTEEKVKEVAGVGRDIVVHAWKRDRTWFERSDLAYLFETS
jgi:hypothetical protein